MIAWDGRTLAADRRSNFGSTPLTTTKIRRAADGSLIGACGHTNKCRAVLAWYDAGAKPEAYTDMGDAQMIQVDTQGRVWMRDESPTPVLLEDKCVALGSGMAEALVAMACGKSAREAVELASRFNTSCGSEVDVLEL